MIAMTSQIASLTIVYSVVYSGADQGKHQRSASLAFVREIHRWPVNSPHKGPVTRKMFPFDDVICFNLTHPQLYIYFLNYALTIYGVLVDVNYISIETRKPTLKSSYSNWWGRLAISLVQIPPKYSQTIAHKSAVWAIKIQLLSWTRWTVCAINCDQLHGRY